jgi:hypothetical protein
MSDSKWERMAEKTYYWSFWFVLIVFVIASIGTAIVRRNISPDIELVPENLLNFLEHVLWVFVLPVSLKVGGEALPEALAALRGITLGTYKSKVDDRKYQE